MIEIKSRLKGLADKGTWAARGASFVGKVKATKVVWFPPEPVETGTKAGSAAKKATKRATKQATGAAKESISPTKKMTNLRRG